jgi:PAS domain S-box-containing protein
MTQHKPTYEELAYNVKVLEKEAVWRKQAEDALQKAKNELETRVEERTTELFEANKQLQKEIMDRKYAEETLRASEKKYSTVVENSKDGIVVIRDGVLKFVNKASIELVGYTPEEMGDANFFNYVASDYRDLVINRYADRMKGKDIPSIYEIELLKKDGKTIPVELNAIRIDYKGELADLVFLRDITDRKVAEKETRGSEMRNRNLFKNAQVGMYKTMVDGSEVLAVNNKLAEIFDSSIEEMLAEPATLRWASAKDRDKMLRKLKETGSLVDYELDVLTKRGERKTVLASIKLYSEDGTLEGTAIDITRRKKVEQELMSKSANLEEVNTALEVLLDKRREDKLDLENNVLNNVNELILPYIEKIKGTELDERQEALFSIIEANLNEIISPFSRGLSSKFLNFTPKQIQVANLIKIGKNTKQIAEFMNISPRTVDTHRKNIRSKIGLKEKRASLRTRLISFQ